MALPNFRINPYVQPYVGSANKELGEVLDQRIAQYDANQEFDDVLGYQTDTLLQNVAPFQGDQNYAKQLMHQTREQLAERAKSGDYENMGREVKRSARNFAAQATPLIENQKRVAEYQKNMDELYRTGKISVDTYSKAKGASLGTYKGIDPNNVKGSMFSGFVPSPDINVSEKVDKFLSGWKENGGTKIIPDGEGGFTKIDFTNASEKEIAAAAQEYLKGDSEFVNYAQTQHAIGNEARIIDEATNAISAGTKKHGFYKQDVSLQWEPEYVHTNKTALTFARNLQSTPSPATINPNVVNIFKSSGTELDDQGKLILSSLVSKENGKYFMYTDDKGNHISKTEYNTQETSRQRRQVQSEGMTVPQSVHKIEISQEQAVKDTKPLNDMLMSMAAENFLKEAMNSGKITSKELLNNQQFVNDYLRINQKRYSSPDYLKKVYNNYEEALSNSAVITDNSRWDISNQPGAVSAETTGVKDDDILANLDGQSIGILSTDKNLAGFRKGQKADLNSLVDKLTEDGYSIKSRKIGPTKYNPFSDQRNQPGMQYTFIVEKEGEPTKVISAVASIRDDDFQPIQDVYSLAYKGLSGNVPFNAPNSRLGALNGQLRVRTTTDVDPKDGKRKFASFVEILDSKGNKISGPLQNIPLEDFADVYKDYFAPNAIDKYLKKK